MWLKRLILQRKFTETGDIYMEKKKIIFIAAVLVAMTVLSSCGKKNSIDGKWKFDDGSTIRFNTKNGTCGITGKISPITPSLKNTQNRYK